ncbi:MAG TPA: metalloregulator ArsR/SmtB family transcription factor [Mycobacteriales bacterium]|nr:metalloregulator ArsR/SmtB family transcription factor [Mycobacteriales bacterium]HWC34176.1 metalloregulator ArsR/SmtB family transcription factor [Mycobacteriales bacterium]
MKSLAESVVQAATATPLYQVKGEFFKVLGHPARIRVLELLSEQERSVGELAAEVGLETSHLSQQLGVLRRAGVVIARKDGTSVIYSLAAPEVAELLAVARRVLAVILSGQVDVLKDLEVAATPRRAARR